MKHLETTQHGITRYFGIDHQTGVNVYKSVQDVEPIVEALKSLPDPRQQKGRMRHIGSIPMLLCEKWAQECGHNVFSKEWQEYAWKQFNSAEYRKLNPWNYKVRTTPR